MPCVLEDWEIEYEEKRRNKEEYDLAVNNAGLAMEVACQALNYLEKRGHNISHISPLVEKWWKEHKKRDTKWKVQSRI